MGRRPCCSKEEGLNRGAWTAMEDKILIDYIKVHGEGKWRNIPKAAGLKRCGKSCRLRWLNYLRPDIKRGNISRDEEDLIIRLHKLLGNRWSLIAGRLPGRTDNEIKNYWNSVLSKRAQFVKKSDHHTNEDGKKQRIIIKNAPTSTSKVIHAKARRCTTKVFITPQQQTIIGEEIINPSSKFETAVESESSEEINPSSSEFAMDFGIGDISNISEALASVDDNITQFGGFDFCDFGFGQALLSPRADIGMVGNWSGGINDDCVEFEANLDSDFGFLAAFLDQSTSSVVHQ